MAKRTREFEFILSYTLSELKLKHRTLKAQLKTTHLYVVSVGAGLGEDGWDGRVTANFQIIFGALVPLKEISKKAR